jgi:hypothetical protein
VEYHTDFCSTAIYVFVSREMLDFVWGHNVHSAAGLPWMVYIAISPQHMTVLLMVRFFHITVGHWCSLVTVITKKTFSVISTCSSTEYCCLYESAWAALTKYHTLGDGWLKQQDFIFSLFWMSEVQDESVGRSGFFWHPSPSLAVPSCSLPSGLTHSYYLWVSKFLFFHWSLNSGPHTC